MARTEFLQIRLTPDDRRTLEAVAQIEHLDLSTWARQTLLKAADERVKPASKSRAER